ncbi:MAG: alpha-ketoacid dehydrogenase subunit beta, partial [Piscirickettsiaceae bacterium]
MNEWTMIEAINHALADQMRANPNVVVLGEDVGVNGGVFRATDGLQAEFGEQRVVDTPLAESAIVGMSIGMATQGLIAIPEIQFMGFIYSAVDQILSHAARLRNRTRGRLTCPIVIRAPFGGGIHAPEHHSESTEA